MNIKLGEKLKGPAGEAVELLFSGVPENVEQTATLASWFLTCKGQAAYWDKYALSIIHLRPIEGIEAVIDVPGATHEVILIALNPERNPQATDPETWQFLFPINVAEQIQLPNDESAKLLLKECALGVVEGFLWAEPPLSGQREPWLSALVRTSAHHRGEEHAP